MAELRWILLLAGCQLASAAALPASEVPQPWPGEELAGGETTVFDEEHSSFGRALHNLSSHRWAAMRAGKSLFENPWEAPAAAESSPRQGLGPLFNATSCVDCHYRDGRGSRHADGSPAPAPLIARLGVADAGPDPVYGHQLNDRGLGLPPEGHLEVEYEEVTGSYPDGQPYRLRRPRVRLEELSSGALAAGTHTSARIAPTLVGLGLLEAVPEEQLRALEDPDDRDGDGISGRLQMLPAHPVPRVGRFGWKAGQAEIEAQVARAFAEDLGVTSSLYPEPNCPPTGCGKARAQAAAAEPELSGTQLARIALYVRLLAPPARRGWQEPPVLRGRESFLEIGCGGCHRPQLTTGPGTAGRPVLPELAGQTIRPYTDLLLHDLGPELADGVREHRAGPAEWRTAPLWGLGLLQRVNGHVRLLHDGRARSAEEAILWHGGEAESSREAFVRLPAERRADLLRFLDSL